MLPNNLKTLVLFLTIMICDSLLAQQRLEMEGTEIIGNKELPQVLYIVPWKSTQRVNFPNPPVESIMDQVLKPIERSTFKRQVRYHEVIFPIATTSE